MKLPDEYLNSHIFIHELKPILKIGSVFRFPYIFPDDPEMNADPKRFILMTTDHKRLYLFLKVTSKKTPESILEEEIFIFIKANEEEVFEIDTAIDLNRAIPQSADQIIAHHKAKKFKPLKNISESLLKKIYLKLSDKSITQQMVDKYKKRILKGC